MRQFLLYAVIRLGLWAAIWWLLILVGTGPMLAAAVAALIAMLLSILFLDRLRGAAAMRWKAADDRRAERRGPAHDEDAEYEDALLDGTEGADDEAAAGSEGADGDGADRDGEGPAEQELRAPGR